MKGGFSYLETLMKGGFSNPETLMEAASVIWRH